MFVSFLMPVYNVEKYLGKCIDSLLVQKGCDFEIVLVDDGSTDDSGRICDMYAEKYSHIRVIHKENEGLLMTRRRGFREAKGDWFICIDSDDYVAENLLERVVQTIWETDANMVMYNFEYFDKRNVHTPSRLKLKDGEVFEGEGKQRIYEKRLLSVDVNSLCIRAFKREILDFATDYSGCGIRNMCEDALQVLPLYTDARKIVYLDTPLYYYRKGEDTITASRSIASWHASQACFIHTERYLNIWNISEEVRARFYTRHLEYLCNYVRWLFSADGEKEAPSKREMIAELKASPDYIASRDHYCRGFAHSKYLSILAPVTARLVEAENLVGIRLVYGMEKLLLKMKKK